MVLATILVDTREQNPWEFEDYSVDTTSVTLRTGDYTLEQFCDHDAENDTYLPQFAVERKSGQDFLQSITHRREQFKDEIKRAADWEDPLAVIIEEPWNTFEFNQGFMSYRDVTPSQVQGTVEKWGRYYNCEWTFAGSRPAAEQHAFDTLLTRLRAERTGSR